MQCYVERIQDAFGPSILVYDDTGSLREGGNTIGTYLAMTRDDHRRLIAAVFDTPLADGKPAGVYISREGPPTPHRPQRWAFTVRGRLDFELVMRRVRH